MSDKENIEPVNFIDTEDGDTEVQLDGGKSEKTAAKSESDERLAKAETEQAQLRTHLNNLYGTIANQSNQQNQPDPYSAQLDDISEQERALGIQFEALRAANGLTPANIKDFDNKARSLQQKRVDISTQRSLQAVVPQLLSAQQVNHYKTQYADVHGNDQALLYAKSRYDMLRAMGEADSPQLVDRAMNDARVQFKLAGAKSSPTDQDRRQLSGVGGGGGRNMSNNTVKMGKAEKAMAMALYGEKFNGDEKKVFAQWAKGPGLRAKKAAEKGRRA